MREATISKHCAPQSSRKTSMALSDSAEYWMERKAPWLGRWQRPKAKPPEHECAPRGGPPGTHNRWKCAICGRRFASVPRKET